MGETPDDKAKPRGGGQKRRQRGAGTVGYIVKPFAPDPVLDRTSQILGLPG